MVKQISEILLAVILASNSSHLSEVTTPTKTVSQVESLNLSSRIVAPRPACLADTSNSAISNLIRRDQAELDKQETAVGNNVAAGKPTGFTTADFRKVSAVERRKYLQKMQEQYTQVLLPTQKIESMRQAICLKEALGQTVTKQDLFEAFAIDEEAKDKALAKRIVTAKKGYCTWFLKDSSVDGEQNAFSVLQSYIYLRRSVAKAHLTHCGSEKDQVLDKWGRNTNFIPCKSEIKHLFAQLRIPFLAKEMWAAPELAQLTQSEWKTIKKMTDGYFAAERKKFDAVNYYSRLQQQLSAIDNTAGFCNEDDYANDRISIEQYNQTSRQIVLDKRAVETKFLKYYNQFLGLNVASNNNKLMNQLRKQGFDEYYQIINTKPIVALLKIKTEKLHKGLTEGFKVKDYAQELLAALTENQRIFKEYSDSVNKINAYNNYRKVLSLAEMQNFVKYFDEANIFGEKTKLYSATIQHDLKLKVYQDLGLSIGLYVGAAIMCSALFVAPQARAVGMVVASLAVKAAFCDLGTNLALNLYFSKAAANDYRSRYFQFFATSGMTRESSQIFFREIQSLNEARRNYIFAALSVPMFVGTRQMIKSIINKNILSKQAAQVLEQAAEEVK